MDCTSCPSFLSVEEAAVKFKRNTGAPMCARYAIPLGRPGNSETSNATIRQHFAMECDSYMLDRPTEPAENRSFVMDPDESVIQEFIEPGFTPAELNTCRQCKNAVRADVVANEIGFPVELCRAKGKLLLSPTKDCKKCPFAADGPMSVTTDGLEIKSIYTEGFRVSVVKVAERVYAQGGTDIDPNDYESALPVSPEEEATGIRAWRRIESPYPGKADQFLPIFNPSSFDEEHRILIPATGDENMPEQYVDYQNLLWDFVTNCFNLNETLCLQGMPGVGKTEFARFAAWLMQVPFTRFVFNNDSEVEDLLGSPSFDPVTGTSFNLGRIPKSFCVNGLDLFDELNAAPHSLRQVLRPVFDKGTELVVDMASPAIHVKRAPYKFLLVAQNPSHDVRNSGVEELAGAEFDRLSPVTVNLPPDAVERHIISMRCNNDDFQISDAEMDKIMAIACDIRTLAADGVIPFTWGIRQQIKVARKLPYYPLEIAYKRAALDFYEDEVCNLVLDAINSYNAS